MKSWIIKNKYYILFFILVFLSFILGYNKDKQFIKQYAQDAMGQKVGGRIVDEQYIEDLVDFTTKDIGFFDR